MAKACLVFVKHLWSIFPAILIGAAEIFRWWFGVNQSPPHWLFWLLLVAGIALAIFLTYREVKIKQIATEVKYPQREKAYEIHSKVITLETGLWVARDKLLKDEDPQDNAEVKEVLANIKSEVNNLATLVNNRDFEELTGAILSLYEKYLKFHANAYKHPFFDTLNMAHRRIRWFINHKVKD